MRGVRLFASGRADGSASRYHDPENSLNDKGVRTVRCCCTNNTWAAVGGPMSSSDAFPVWLPVAVRAQVFLATVDNWPLQWSHGRERNLFLLNVDDRIGSELG